MLIRNVIANYVGQTWAALAGVVMLPLYYEFLGAEAYGLVGFFALLSIWLSLLTVALSPVVSREVARHRGQGTMFGRDFQSLLRGIEVLLAGLALLTMLLVLLASPWLANDWLKPEHLDSAIAARCIALMGVVVGLRWGVTLYTGVLSGMEAQVRLNGLVALFATIRYGGAYVLLRSVSADPYAYFLFQVLVSMLELLVYRHTVYAYLTPRQEQFAASLRLSVKALREVLPFTSAATYTALLWVLVTQVDKLVLSHRMPLAEYGEFALIVLIANGVLQLVAPVNQALTPRLTYLYSLAREDRMLLLYRTATQGLVLLALGASGVLFLFAPEVLFVFTGTRITDGWQIEVMRGFGLGNGLLVVGAMQYLLQYAHGKMRLHVINTSISSVVQVPIMIYLAVYHGAVAVAHFWLLFRLLTFLLWPAIVHRVFAPGLHSRWLLQDILAPLLGVSLVLAAAAVFASPVLADMDSRLGTAVALAGIGLATLIGGALFATEIRRPMMTRLASLLEARHA